MVLNKSRDRSVGATTAMDMDTGWECATASSEEPEPRVPRLVAGACVLALLCPATGAVAQSTGSRPRFDTELTGPITPLDRDNAVGT